MSSKTILQTFDNYLKARIKFAQNIADASARTVQVEFLLKCGAIEHLIPLLTDPSIKVQQYSVLALGRLVNSSLVAAQNSIQQHVVPLLIREMDERSKYFKKSAMFTLRGLAKHSSEMAGQLLGNGALDGVICCMEDFDPGVKESAIWAISTIVKHCVAHAEAVVAAGMLPYLKLALEEPEICVKQVSAGALSDIACKDMTLAQAVVEAGVVPALAKCITSPSPKLKQAAFLCLSNIAKHSEQMAEIVLEADVASDALLNLDSNSEEVKKAAASLICNIVKHHCQFAQLIVNSGGLGGLVKMISNSEESSIFPAVLTLGFISSEADNLALAAISANAVDALMKVLEADNEAGVKAAAVWAIGQIGKHSAEHATSVASTNVLMTILKTYKTACDEDLKQKCKGTMKQIIRKCRSMEFLEPLLHVAPVDIMKYAVLQFAHVLPTDPKARRLFVTSGSLKRLQEIHAPPGSSIMEYILEINNCFPIEIVRYYSPTYPETLLDLVESHVPEPRSANEVLSIEDPEDADLVAEINVPPKAVWDSCAN